jgi:hypothetical protein
LLAAVHTTTPATPIATAKKTATILGAVDGAAVGVAVGTSDGVAVEGVGELGVGDVGVGDVGMMVALVGAAVVLVGECVGAGVGTAQSHGEPGQSVAHCE